MVPQTHNAVTITADNLKDWLAPQLPPQGKRTGFEDAQIWDWTRDPDVFRQPNVESVAAQSVTKPISAATAVMLGCSKSAS